MSADLHQTPYPAFEVIPLFSLAFCLHCPRPSDGHCKGGYPLSAIQRPVPVYFPRAFFLPKEMQPSSLHLYNEHC